jgi:hypothetical protein
LEPATPAQIEELAMLKAKPSAVLARQKEQTRKQMLAENKVKFRRKSLQSNEKRNSTTLDDDIQRKQASAIKWKRGHPAVHEDEFFNDLEAEANYLHAEIKNETPEQRKLRLEKEYDLHAHKVEEDHEKHAELHHKQTELMMESRRKQMKKRLLSRIMIKRESKEGEDIQRILSRPLTETLVAAHKVCRKKAKTPKKMERLLDKIDLDRDGHVGKRELLALTRVVAKNKDMTLECPQHVELWESLHAMEASDHGMHYQPEIMRETIMRWWQIGRFDKGSHFDMDMAAQEAKEMAERSKSKTKTEGEVVVVVLKSAGLKEEDTMASKKNKKKKKKKEEGEGDAERK